MTYMITYLTHQKWIDYNVNVRPEVQGHGGGMAVKTQRIIEALGRRYNIQATSDIEKIDAPYVLVEPLYLTLFKPKDQPELHWEKLVALGELASQGRTLILVCSEWELMRWQPVFREKVLATFDKITCNCEYQANLFNYFGVKPDGILCDPIQADLFCPPKNDDPDLIVLATGHISWQKNTEAVIEVFGQLMEQGIQTSYIGSADLWGKNETEYNKELETDLKQVTTHYHKSLSQQEVVSEMQKAKVGLWCAMHETYGQGFAELLSCGRPVIAHDHGLRNERPYYDVDIDTILNLLTSEETWTSASKEARDWTNKNVSYDVFLQQFSEVI